MRKLIVILSSLALLLSLTSTAFAADPTAKGGKDNTHKGDNLPGPRATKQAALKEKAREMVFKGQATADRQGPGRQGRQGPVRPARVRG